MKLNGIRVLDLSSFLPGPHFTMMMADHGAEVIALEGPSGEPTREIGLKQNGHSIWFNNVFRGKKSIQINLKSELGLQTFYELIKTVDVIVEGFRPGVVARLGIDYDTLKKINPGIVYCSISAYGQTGEKRLQAAHDLSVQADSGAVFINEGQDGLAAQVGMPVADMAGSLMGFAGVLMALIAKQQTGKGDYVDISMQDALVAWYPNIMGPVFAQARSPEVKQERSWGGSAMYRIYQTADGKSITLGGSELKFAKNLLQALGREDLLAICQQPPGQQQQVIDFFTETFSQQPYRYWQEFLDKIDICWAPVRSLYDAMQEPHLLQRQMLIKDEQGNQHLGVPIKYSEQPAKPQFTLAKIGEHTHEVLNKAGISAEQLTQMAEQGTINKQVKNG
ncbi:CaiB/BaiF CoA-transferase family protein [Paraferrimonas sp. SM1919]|uniref:CaiB/BaiF CoA transferase family protein n=1 Tax=Paraferrimonas sp. SM1919 TaxID=2662263 RepID=UPI0013D37631|nr:CoA transferase [Paraferrimonas sp. SM1919]